MDVELDIADMIAAAKYSGKGNYLAAGKGTLILSVLKTFKGQGGLTGVAEFLVEEGSGPPGFNAPGTTCSFVKTFAGKHTQFYLGLFKEMFETLNDSRGEDMSAFAAKFRAATDEKMQPLRGARVRFEAFNTVAREKGTAVVNVKWLNYPNTPESMDDGIKKLVAAGL